MKKVLNYGLLEILNVQKLTKAYSAESLKSGREPLPKKGGLALSPGFFLCTLSANTTYEISTIGVRRAHCLHGHRNNLLPTGHILIFFLLSRSRNFGSPTCND